MKIQGNNQIDGKDTYSKVLESRRNGEAENKEGSPGADSSQDRISLSGRAREISELKALIEQLPDIRTDRVESLRKAIDTGNYNIDALKVAEKVLEEI